VVGLATLTRYSMFCLILPVMIFVARAATRRKSALVTAVAATFVLITAPWLVRNTMLSGVPFGTATFAPLAGTSAFPGDTLERSLTPSFAVQPGDNWGIVDDLTEKATQNIREILVNEVPRMGGSWVWALFLVGLLVPFRNPSLGRLRWFVVGTLVLLIPVEAIIRTNLSADSPEINTENLLVVFSPLVLIFGTGLLFVLLEPWKWISSLHRHAALSGLVALLSLPMLLAFFPPRPRLFSPPYYPPRIQQVGRYLKAQELLMSDIPWAFAWYGRRQAVWLTLNWKRDFFEINGSYKKVNGLFISTRTTDGKFLSSWFGGDNRGWGSFLIKGFVQREIPDGFPLNQAPEGLFANGELLLMDRERWVQDGR